MKYIDGGGKVRTLITERHLFKGRELFHRLPSLPRLSGKTNKNPQPEELDSGNEADTKPEVEEECMWELNPLVTSINKLDVNNTADDVGKWYINEELNLALGHCSDVKTRVSILASSCCAGGDD